MNNIIRTKAVELSVIPAIAYKQKLSGGSGIKILRLDKDVSAVCTIDRRTGETKPYGKVDGKLFPIEAFDEALEMTSGMPYSARGNISLDVSKYEPPKSEVLPEEETDMVDSDEYNAITERYSDEKGKLNYALMNKDFMQFAAKSKTVSEMLASGAKADDILLFIVKSRATFVSGKKKSLDDKQVSALIETLDEINPRSAFKELKDYIKKRLSKKR
ncbi:MAG: hypothetical protein LBI36_03020 [Oscillospiraceae bacterium]|jgi:hypothetical protein|nr:hypothetical protein [Oscillospiraceae bacterium]